MPGKDTGGSEQTVGLVTEAVTTVVGTAGVVVVTAVEIELAIVKTVVATITGFGWLDPSLSVDRVFTILEYKTKLFKTT